MVKPAGHNEGFPHHVAETGGEIQTALGIDGVIILTNEHLCSPPFVKLYKLAARFFTSQRSLCGKLCGERGKLPTIHHFCC